MPPTQSPEKVAVALAELAERPRRELHVPRSAELGLALHVLFPRLVERVIYDALGRWHFGGRQRLDALGNLWQPAQDPPAIQGRRGPRIGLAGLLGWLLGHYGRRGLRLLKAP
jgi:hypothetical protein